MNLPALARQTALTSKPTIRKYIRLSVENQQFGLPILMVEDILKKQKITPIPLSPREVLGALNLRGGIVVVVDLRTRLGLAPGSIDQGTVVVVRSGTTLYGLCVDKVYEVTVLEEKAISPCPDHLDKHWLEVCDGVFPMERSLMLLLSTDKLFPAKS